MNLRTLSTLILAAPLFACSSAEEVGIEAELCEHMKDGPAVAVTAAAEGAAAPSATHEHTRVDVTLLGAGSDRSGYVSYEAEAAGPFVFGLSADVPFAITDGAGAAVTATKEALVLPCTEVVVAYEATLAVGPYKLRFGPTTSEKLGFVAEAEGEDAHD